MGFLKSAKLNVGRGLLLPLIRVAHRKQTKYKKQTKFAVSARFFTALPLVQNDKEIIYPLTIFVTLSDSEGSRGNESKS